MIARACVASLVLCTAIARADDVSRARELYEDGLEKYDAGNYAEAIRAWQASYVMSPAPILLFNIGQAYRLSSDCTHALEFYDRYTRAQPKPDNSAELDDAVAKCKPTVVPPQPKDPVPPPQPSRHRPDHRVLGLAIAVGGVAAGFVAGYCAVDTRNLTHSLQTTTTWSSAQDGLQSRGRFENVLGWTSAGLGAAAIAAGVVLYVRSLPVERSYVLAPTRGGAMFAVTLPF